MLFLRIIQDMDTSLVILHVIFTYNTGYGYQPGNTTVVVAGGPTTVVHHRKERYMNFP
jgi:hypothetical protein